MIAQTEPPLTDNGTSLVDELLAEQQLLTPVARFSRKHEAHDLPAQSKYYRDLIPLSAPGEGEQYAFAVDLDACTGCKGCVSACHSLNGLDEEESWRDVGVVFGGTVIEPFQQTVTTACHHCADPACLLGCPVMAYDKDPVTGIVRHLDDQCIGCQYCVLKCPYDVPKYNKRLGIVRKCDMCTNRLTVGEAPACVQACPNEAIRIETVSRESVHARNEREGKLVPGAFDSDYTQPTTRYHGNKVMPLNMRTGEAHGLEPEHSHFPLVVMLVLTQLSVGAFVANLLSNSTALAIWALGAGFAGLGFSILHLGRPFGAWRAFLGLRTSWLSREIIALGGFAKVAVLAVAVRFFPIVEFLTLPIALGCAAMGVAGVFCSVMVYADTRRALWNFKHTTARFFGTAAVLGSATAYCVTGSIGWLAIWIVTGLTLLAAEGAFLYLAKGNLSRSVAVMCGPLRYVTIARFAVGALGVLTAFIGWPALVLWVAAELLGRYLYFTAVTAPRMPGHFSTS